MKTLLAFAFLTCLVALISAVPASPGNPAAPIPYVRVARASPQPEKDLQGDESAYVVYPYYYPYYWGSRYVLVG